MDRLVLWDTDVRVNPDDLVIFKSHEDAELYEVADLTKTRQTPIVLLTDLNSTELVELLSFIGLVNGIDPHLFVAKIDKTKIHNLYELVRYIKFGVIDSNIDFDLLIDSIELRYLKTYLRSYYEFRCRLLADLISSFFRSVREKSYQKILNTVPPSTIIDHLISSSNRSDQYPPTLKGLIHNYKKIFNVLASGHIKDKAYNMSAYFFAMAKTYYKNADYQDVSLLLIHRSVEMYLLSLALENDLIRSTERGFRFKYNDENRLVGVSTLASELKSIGNVTFSAENEMYIRHLNSMRNLSFYTHGVFSYSPKELDECLTKGSQLISTISGNGAWKNLVNELVISLSPFHQNDHRAIEKLIQLYETRY